MTPDRSGRQAPAGEWVEAGRAGFFLACAHRPGQAGRLDETARRLSHEELAVAQLLAGEGHHVRSLPETRGRGRTPDLMVCGNGVEVKSWDPLDRREGRAPTARSVQNKLLDAGGQAKAVVLFGRGRQVDPATVRTGLALYSRHRFGSRVAAVRVLGDSFDLSWSRLVPGGLSQPVLPDPGRRARRSALVMPSSAAPRRPLAVEGRPPPSRESPGLAL